MPDGLRVVVRTPHEVALDVEARSLRVLTESGHVGLRPRMEPVVLAVDAGLVLVRTAAGERFVGTAGGLLTCDGGVVTVYTPLAVTGDSAAEISAALEAALAEPGSDLVLRTALDRLEGRIVAELRRTAAPPAGGPGA
ncbi:MAG: hypothetical protein AB7O28_21730 [Vicinamibacterales bacterium]